MLSLNALLLRFLVIMFSSTGLFKQIECPEYSQCTLPNCIFSHDFLASDVVANARSIPQDDIDEGQSDLENPRKRRKTSLVDSRQAAKSPRGAPHDASTTTSSPRSLKASRPISPPPLRRSKVIEIAQEKAKAETKRNGASLSAREPAEVSLNPQMLANAPASHQIRMQLIEMLHRYMNLLNEEVKRSTDPSKLALELSARELVIKALSEEERIAKQSPAVYTNVVKNRIMRLKKMKFAEWKEERLKEIAKQAAFVASEEAKIIPKVIDTGLTAAQEISFLSRLLAKQPPLSKYGYVVTPPTPEEIAIAAKGVEAAQNWEVCDRCKTRFQVFPSRREEDGALASGGKCTYHPAKPRRPIPVDKANKVSRDMIYACCNESLGTTPGCTTAATHVYKISEPKRLALVLPFESTPSDPSPPSPPTAVCFDCEMGYTTHGLELVRLTATLYPSGAPLMDVLVRPIGTILDLNSRFSGVFPNDYANAPPYSPTSPSTSLQIMDSPSAARALLFTHLTPSTPLIGHALDNDLNATRIIHPSIVDTVLLYPHPKGLPVRCGLKMLMKKHLDRDIQMGGAQGHDSSEDARAAGELVRLKVKEVWRGMRREGWEVKEEEFFPPVSGRVGGGKMFGGLGEG